MTTEFTAMTFSCTTNREKQTSQKFSSRNTLVQIKKLLNFYNNIGKMKIKC